MRTSGDPQSTSQPASGSILPPGVGVDGKSFACLSLRSETENTCAVKSDF